VEERLMLAVVAIVLGLLVVAVGVITAIVVKPTVYRDRFGDPVNRTRGGKLAGAAIAGAGLVLVLVAGVAGSVYKQDPGEAVVLRSISGATIGQSTDEGFHVKAPWVKALTFDVRNNTVSYVAGGETDQSGGNATGPQITFQDQSGTSGNADVVVM
jgi:hypothetical protein